jgi:long-chain acyl-CoA synthetase
MDQYSWFKSYDPGMRAYCKERLTAYKVPRQIEIRQSLPKSAIGKPLARILLDEEMAKKQK